VLISLGFLEIFLLTLVLLMVQTAPGPNNQPDAWGDTIFTVVVVLLLYFAINTLFLGADEVANAMEDPSHWLPLRAICESTQRDVMRVLDDMRALRRAEAAEAARRQRRRVEEEAARDDGRQEREQPTAHIEMKS